MLLKTVLDESSEKSAFEALHLLQERRWIILPKWIRDWSGKHRCLLKCIIYIILVVSTNCEDMFFPTNNAAISTTAAYKIQGGSVSTRWINWSWRNYNGDQYELFSGYFKGNYNPRFQIFSSDKRLMASGQFGSYSDETRSGIFTKEFISITSELKRVDKQDLQLNGGLVALLASVQIHAAGSKNYSACITSETTTTLIWGCQEFYDKAYMRLDYISRSRFEGPTYNVQWILNNKINFKNPSYILSAGYFQLFICYIDISTLALTKVGDGIIYHPTVDNIDSRYFYGGSYSGFQFVKYSWPDSSLVLTIYTTSVNKGVHPVDIFNVGTTGYVVFVPSALKEMHIHEKASFALVLIQTTFGVFDYASILINTDPTYGNLMFGAIMYIGTDFYFDVLSFDSCITRDSSSVWTNWRAGYYLKDSSPENLCYSISKIPIGYGINGTSLYLANCSQLSCVNCSNNYTFCNLWDQTVPFYKNPTDGIWYLFPDIPGGLGITVGVYTDLKACTIQNCQIWSSNYASWNLWNLSYRYSPIDNRWFLENETLGYGKTTDNSTILLKWTDSNCKNWTKDYNSWALWNIGYRLYEVNLSWKAEFTSPGFGISPSNTVYIYKWIDPKWSLWSQDYTDWLEWLPGYRELETNYTWSDELNTPGFGKDLLNSTVLRSWTQQEWLCPNNYQICSGWNIATGIYYKNAVLNLWVSEKQIPVTMGKNINLPGEIELWSNPGCKSWLFNCKICQKTFKIDLSIIDDDKNGLTVSYIATIFEPSEVSTLNIPYYYGSVLRYLEQNPGMFKINAINAGSTEKILYSQTLQASANQIVFGLKDYPKLSELDKTYVFSIISPTKISFQDNNNVLSQGYNFTILPFTYQNNFLNDPYGVSIELKKAIERGKIAGMLINGGDGNGKYAFQTLLMLFAFDSTGTLMRFAQILEVLSLLYYINIEYGSLLDGFLNQIEPYDIMSFLAFDENPNNQVYHSKGFKGKLSKKAVGLNIMEVIPFHVVFYLISWIIRLLNNLLFRNCKVPKWYLYLMFYHYKVHLFVFNIMFLEFMVY